MSNTEDPFSVTAFDRLGIKKLGGGEVSETFLYKSVVIHLSPVMDIPNEDAAIVLNRWSYPDKPVKLQALQAALQKLPDIKIPLVYQTGEIMHRGRKTPYLIEDFVVGKTLLKETFEGVDPKTYERIIRWLSGLHNNHRQKDLLRDYYHQRLASLRRLVQVAGGMATLLGEDHVESLGSLVNKMQANIDVCVGEDEVVTTIHGDLRGENVILNDGTIGMIDFEQGVNGGDWFADIQKLLMVGNNDLPDSNRPSRYRPPLDMSIKQRLLVTYLSGRQDEDLGSQVKNDLGNPTSDRFRLRQKLFTLDNSLSMAAMKYYLGLANQLAGIGQIDIRAILHRITVMEGKVK